MRGQGYGPLALVLAVAWAFFTGYQGLAVLTPHFLESLDYAAVLVGASTTAFVATAAATSLGLGFIPRGGDIRRGCVIASLLLGLPCFALPHLHDAAAVLTLVSLRGIGLGIAGVLLGTAVAVVAPPGRRGLAIGLLGVIAAGVAVFAQAGCLFLAGRFGFTAAFTAVGVLALLGMVPLFSLGELPLAEGQFLASIRDALHSAVALPSLYFFLTSMTYGAVVSFGPERLGRAGADHAIVFFLVFAGASSVSRLVTGWLLDRLHSWLALGVALLCGAFALAILGSSISLEAAVGSAVLYGVSFGAVSTGGIIVLTNRVEVAKFGLVNGLFNFAGLAGLGAGGIVFGIVADVTDYSTMFLLAPLPLLAAVGVLAADVLSSRRAVVPLARLY